MEDIENVNVYINYLYFSKSSEMIEMITLMKIEINHKEIYIGTGMGITGYLDSEYHLSYIAT